MSEVFLFGGTLVEGAGVGMGRTMASERTRWAELITCR